VSGLTGTTYRTKLVHMENNIQKARDVLDLGGVAALDATTSPEFLSAVSNLLGAANAMFYGDFHTTVSQQVRDLAAPIAAAIIAAEERMSA
jgi:hypothetical protein